jgi:hypothetical protein
MIRTSSTSDQHRAERSHPPGIAFVLSIVSQRTIELATQRSCGRRATARSLCHEHNRPDPAAWTIATREKQSRDRPTNRPKRQPLPDIRVTLGASRGDDCAVRVSRLPLDAYSGHDIRATPFVGLRRDGFVGRRERDVAAGIVNSRHVGTSALQEMQLSPLSRHDVAGVRSSIYRLGDARKK